MLKGYTFDDVLLVPQHSDLLSRDEADPSTKLGTIDMKIPIVSANMDTITGPNMAIAMHEAGGLGILHRYTDPADIAMWIRELQAKDINPVVSLGVQPIDSMMAAEYFRNYDVNSVCIDIAHGDSAAAVRMVKHCKQIGYTNIIAGNVATGYGAQTLMDAGANVIKVGVGPGSMCTTRIVTGHGVPQLTAIMQAHAARGGYDNVQIIADGGIRNSGDIVKALAAGADAVMVGGLLAGTYESPAVVHPSGSGLVYRGMASRDAQVSIKGRVSNDAPEGESTIVPVRGSVKPILAELVGGIRSGMSYSGVRTLTELRQAALFMEVSANTVHENQAHGKK